MHSNSYFSRLFVSCLLWSCAVLAPGPVLAQAADSAEVAAIRTLLTTTQPDMPITSITPSPLAGLYQVELSNGHAIFVSSDAKFLIPGDMYESRGDGLVNLGENRRNSLRVAKIGAVDEKDMIVFAPAGERKATLTVFTDVDCPYCRKLHGEIEALNSLGIAVRYLAYPREGLAGPTYIRMISTWCADDRQAIMTSAKRGAEVPVVNCDSPVDAQYQLGREVGVTGTPAVVLEDGTMVPGYVDAATLAGYLLPSQSDLQPALQPAQ
jgi:thiol:disulfide interchange protein DsbC